MVTLGLQVNIPELTQLVTVLGDMMATFTELNQHVSDLQTSVHAINTGLQTIAAEIQALKDQIANGGVVTQEQLDALDATVQATQAEAQGIVTQEGTL